MRRGSGLLLPSEREADRRAQAEALRAQIARPEAESDGRDSPRSQPRRGSICGGLVGTAQQQAGVDRAARLEELRRQYTELQTEITRGEQAAGEGGKIGWRGELYAIGRTVMFTPPRDAHSGQR